uniref:TRAF-type domain-containing protein n=1 Tax=Solanum lycopersicum TaxID=4081 RepID=A0A3Q7FWR1_SOLLC|nr:uncharacterized protein LOC101248379 isoform X1 [Solanum lycopersicum]XP_010319292.1 uncharacterized protein LOC101248379 isoform X1 [Solanum lycopersicum]XP_019068829.1 uncharacterized protein LOC101248379 isoform X1 [Solanum lycopersicum]
MDPPTVEEKIKTAELEDVQLEEVKETKPAAIEEDDALFHCDLFDAEMVQKVADEFLPGLASACIDNTTGGLLNSPASVAVDIRREMVDYLVQRSEMFVAESVVLEGDSVVEVSDNPHDIISDFIDDFAQSKRNFFCKVSSWMLSERREERIDDFVQEMEMNGFWLMARRIAVAQTSIRNIDFKNIYHCSMRFKSEEELSKHITLCGFRELHCENEGCNARFSAAQLELHDSTCPFKILQCEQKCPETLMRREMDRHCITVCPMKLANCPFYPVGCVSTIPQCKTDQHRLENLLPHLTHILKLIHKEASFEALKKRAEHLLEASSPGRLAAARDARSLTVAIKRIDAKLGPLEAEEIKEDNADDADLKDEKKDSTDLSAKKDSSDLSAKKDSTDLSAKKDSSDLSAKKDSTDLSAKKDSSDLSAKKDSTYLSAKKDCSIDLSHNDEQSPQHNSSASPHKTVSPDKSEKVVEPTVTDSTNEHCEKPDSRDLPHYKNDGLKSPDKGEESLSTSEKHQDVTTSAHKLESPKSEDPPKSPEKHHNSTTSEEQKE